MSQVGLLLLESLSLLGYFALFHPENQSVLRWGKSPTILHKVSGHAILLSFSDDYGTLSAITDRLAKFYFEKTEFYCVKTGMRSAVCVLQ